MLTYAFNVRVPLCSLYLSVEVSEPDSIAGLSASPDLAAAPEQSSLTHTITSSYSLSHLHASTSTFDTNASE